MGECESFLAKSLPYCVRGKAAYSAKRLFGKVQFKTKEGKSPIPLSKTHRSDLLFKQGWQFDHVDQKRVIFRETDAMKFRRLFRLTIA